MSVEAPERPRALGAPIKGPAAIGVDLPRFLNLMRTLALTEFKLRFFGSALGYLWQLMRPLMLFGVLYVVFTHVLKFGSDAKFYPVALLSGIVMFVFVSESTGAGVTSLVDRENLVRKVQFPRLVVPLSVVATALLNLSLNMVVVLVFLLASGGEVRAGWLEIPLLVAILTLFSASLATLLSALYVRYRDVKPVWEVLLQLLFYGTPIFYTIDRIPNETLRHLLMMSPLAVIIQQFRHAVIDPSYQSAAAAAGGWQLLLVPAGILLALVVVGYGYFDREAPRIAEDL
ncbi:MAG: ABC transporter permease [Actinobacteria bacterium]|nr:ABC transporter permease [Actinomycetota bacterium]